MYLKYFNRNNFIGDRSILQINQLSTIDKSDVEQINTVSSEGATFIISIFLLIFAVVFILKVGLQTRTKYSSKNIKLDSKIGCRKCYFYNKNFYLKCAVHPDKVLTNEAEDCHDYQPKK